MFGKLTSNKGGFIHENDKRYLWKNGKTSISSKYICKKFCNGFFIWRRYLLEAQLEFFGKREQIDGKQLEERKSLVPQWDSLTTDLERGRALKREMDKSYYTYLHSTGHCRVTYAESYRREGFFVFDELIE